MVGPILMRSPLPMRASRMICSSLTYEPLVDPSSTHHQAPLRCSKWAWRRETLSPSSTMWFSAPRPMRMGLLSRTNRRPSRVGSFV